MVLQKLENIQIKLFGTGYVLDIVFKTILILLLLLDAHLSMAQTKQDHVSILSKENQNDELMHMTEQRIKDLELSIKTIGDKQLSSDIRLGTINATVKLFVDEEKIFQVSSLKNKVPRSYPIRRYLNRLMVLPYEKVLIEWFDTQWVTKFRRAPNGKYYGVIRIFQVFKGYGVDDVLVYEDRTSKDIEVEIEVLDKYLGGTKKEIFDVRLGDVKVRETR